MKNRCFITIMLLALLFTLTGNVNASTLAGPTSLVFVGLASGEDWDRFSSTGLPMYAQLDGGLLSGANSSGQAALRQAGLSYRVLEADLRSGSYYLAESRSSRPIPDYAPYGQIVFETPNTVLLKLDGPQVEALTQAGAELRLITLTPKPMPSAQSPALYPEVIQPDPLVQGMLDQITNSNVYLYDRQLAGQLPVYVDDGWYNIPTRLTTSGIPIQKTTHFVGQVLAADGLDVEYHVWNNATNPNVIGEFTGWSNPDEIYIIGAHIDDVNNTPGADDNASGSVATLLAADILSQYYWGCTLRFALWTGEEQGLLGSSYYAHRSYQRGENILGYLNLDMIAWNTPGSDPYINLIYSPSIPPSHDLALLFADVIEAYNLNLLTRFGTNITGSDHSSFWEHGYSAILAIEDDLGDDFNPYYHSPGDTPTHTDSSYFTNFVKASVATFVHMSDCRLPTGSLNGFITDTSTGQPLQNAAVAAVQGDHVVHATTDQTGFYTLTLPAGAYNVTASMDGYVDQSKNATIVANQVTALDFELDLECLPVTQADFTWLPFTPVISDPVSFTVKADGSDPISYTWNFGDGAGGSGPSPSHAYMEDGEYTVTLTASNACGEVITDHLITVVQSCEPVTNLDFTWLPLEPLNAELITFTAAASGTEPIAFQWDFGDDITGTEKSITHIYPRAGDYNVFLSALNTCSVPVQADKDITVLQRRLNFFLPVIGKH